MIYSRVNKYSRATKEVGICVTLEYGTKKWEVKLQECNYVNERIIIFKMKYYHGYVIVIDVYAPEERNKEKSTGFYNNLQIVLDKCNKNHDVTVAGDFNRVQQS